MTNSFTRFARTGLLCALGGTLALGGCTEGGSDDAASVEVAPENAQVLRRALGPIRGGVTDTESKAVVGLYSQSSGGICSGSLIAPNLVLTAQHCVAQVPTPYVICGQTQFGDVYRGSSFSATTDVSLFSFNRTETFAGSEVFIPPGTRDLCGEDIALILLTSNVPANVTEPYTPRIDVPATPGEDYVAIGYGETGNGRGSGERRIITQRSVDCYGTQCGGFGQVQDGEFVGSDGTCQGDSGGPALDPQDRVFGVLSRGGDGCTSSTYTDVAANADWMRDIGALAAELGGYPEPAWVSLGTSDPVINDMDEDGIADEIDNCIDVANTDQGDVDEDGVGDLCDERDDRDRGGSCAVCNGCNEDAECGDGGTCVNFGDGGVCSVDCADGTACPGDTQCFDVPAAGGVQSLCLNADAGSEGVCHEGFVCGEAVALPADSCNICNPCATDNQCGEGVCLNFGSGGVCTLSCEDAGCPGDSACFEVSGQLVCLNPDAAAAGVCPEAYECAAGESGEPGGDEEPGEPTEGSGSATGGDTPPPFFGASQSSGCAAASSAPGFGFGALLLGLFLGRRRREERASL